MAGDWIKMRMDLAEDPSVIRMAESLCVREELIVGYCHAFWSWVSRQCYDGSVTGVTLESLGRRLNLPGFPEMLAEVGWLEYDDSGPLPVIKIPNFERHLSQGSKQRVLAAERQKRSRHGGVTKTSRSKRDKCVTREEKRREEKKEDPKGSSPPPPPKPDPTLPFSSKAFAEAWAEWMAYRKEIKKPYKPMGVRAQLKRLGEWAESEAIDAIRLSIAQNWQGLFRDRSPPGRPQRDQFAGLREFADGDES